MKTDLLFENCPFITSSNVTLSRIGIADCDALWELMGDKNLYHFEPDNPAQSRMQTEYQIEESDILFQQGKSITLGVYANTDLSHLIGWIRIYNVDQELNQLQLRFLFGHRCVGNEYAAESLEAFCRYLFEMVKVNRIQVTCLAEDTEKQRILEKSGFVREGVLRECNRWERFGIINLAYYAMLASDYALLKTTRSIQAEGEAIDSEEC